VALYLPADLVKHAVDRLRVSRAQPKMLDYLIFRRALILSGGPDSQVVTGMASAPFQQAIQEWARIRTDEEPAPHFFNPFGSGSTTDNGFRSDKYPSNGPSDTASGWATSLASPPFVAVAGSRPRAFTFVEISSGDLVKAFLRAESTDPDKNQKPRLVDTAVWWLRARDVGALGLTDQSEVSDLVDTLRSEVGLTDVEESALFDSAGI
jgi:hypothetical protein